MVEAEATVDSIRLPTSSIRKRRTVVDFGGCHTDSQVYHRGLKSELHRLDDPAATVVRKVATTNDPDYKARVVRLLSQVSDGQADAVTDLVNLVFPKLLVLCRAQLGKWLQEYDEEVALEVLFNFIRQYQVGAFPGIRDSSGLWGILQYKVHKRVQRIARQHITRATRIPVSQAVADEQHPTLNLGSRDMALQRVEDSEVLDKFLRWLPMKDREWFCMSLAGHFTVQIARKFGVTSRTIRNRMARVFKNWQRSIDNQ